MKRVIYSKFSNDRNEAYKIRTDICEDEGRRYVEKIGVTEGGRKHINNVFSMYEGLKKQTADTIFDINKSSLVNGVLTLEYLYKDNLEKVLDELLYSRKYNEFKELVKKYTDNVRGMATEKFEPEDIYYEMFGENADDKASLSMPISNIDMIFANIMVDSYKWTVIDYEWSFPVKVPVEFILYRTILYYLTPQRKEKLGDVDLYVLMGVDKEKEDIYKSMDDSFQNYIIKGNTPLWKLYDVMGKPFYDMPYIARLKKKQQPKAVGYLPDDSTVDCDIKVISLEDDIYELSVNLENDLKILRIDPSLLMSIVKVERLLGIADCEYEMKYFSNGTLGGDDIILFSEENSYIMTDDIKPGTKKVIFRYKIVHVGERMGEPLKRVFDLYSKTHELSHKIDVIKSEDYAVVMELQAKIDALDFTIEAMKNSTSWKVTKPIRSIKRKSKDDN